MFQRNNKEKGGREKNAIHAISVIAGAEKGDGKSYIEN